MINESDFENEHEAVTNIRGRQTAFVVVASANCLYEPNPHAAVRIRPPYGSEVNILRLKDDWALIKFCGKEAWSPRQNLAASLIPERDAVEVGMEPGSNCYFQPLIVKDRNAHVNVEYGPRGGRFVRTSSGFRRYF